jgi:hypothetical protein
MFFSPKAIGIIFNTALTFNLKYFTGISLSTPPSLCPVGLVSPPQLTPLTRVSSNLKIKNKKDWK